MDRQSVLHGRLQLYTNPGRRTWFWYAGICHQAAHRGPVHPSEEEEYNPSRAAAGEEELKQPIRAVCSLGKLEVAIPIEHWGRSLRMLCGPITFLAVHVAEIHYYISGDVHVRHMESSNVRLHIPFLF